MLCQKSRFVKLICINSVHFLIQLHHTKGQLISEWNFGVFKSPQKPTKYLPDFCPSFIGQKSGKYLVGFLGDLKAPKIRFEINWPLDASMYSSSFKLKAKHWRFYKVKQVKFLPVIVNSVKGKTLSNTPSSLVRQ